MENENKSTLLQIRIQKSELENAKIKAQKAGLTLSQVVRKLLKDFVDDPQPKLIFGV